MSVIKPEITEAEVVEEEEEEMTEAEVEDEDEVAIEVEAVVETLVAIVIVIVIVIMIETLIKRQVGVEVEEAVVEEEEAVAEEEAVVMPTKMTMTGPQLVTRAIERARTRMETMVLSQNGPIELSPLKGKMQSFSE
jgi:hypothetical protein